MTQQQFTLNTTIRSKIGSSIPKETKTFGRIVALNNIITGNNYQQTPEVRVRDFIYSNDLPGSIYYSNSSPVVTGVGTNFTKDFAVGGYICLKADPDSNQLTNHRIISSISNNTSMVLDDNPYYTSNGSLDSVLVIKGGNNYSNSDTVVVSGEGTGAAFTVVTSNTGSIVSFNNISPGIGYRKGASINVVSNTGSGGLFVGVTQISTYSVAVPLAEANYSRTDDPTLLVAANGTINGQNEKITANPAYGTGIVKSVQAKNSGFGYQSGEYISFAAFGAINTINIISGGKDYANGQVLVFSGGSPTNQAQGKIVTDSNGSIVNVIFSKGSGYKIEPTIRIISPNGNGAVLRATIGGINDDFIVSGYVNTGGSGRLRGYWTTTRGFLSSDKYLQDSYYYQEYSYEIQSSLSLDSYVSLMKKLFHTAGTELFGRTVKKDNINSQVSVVWEEVNDLDNEGTLDYSNENNSIYHYVLGT